MCAAVDTIGRWIEDRARRYVCVTGVHGIIESQRNDDVRRIHNEAGLVTPDGMPLVWLLRASGYRDADRVYGPDLMLAVFRDSKISECRHFLYGASPETLGELEGNLRERFPRARIVGAYSPPFRPLTDEEDREIIQTINGSRADIVWVGLSTPKQERWMADHRGPLEAPVLIGVGAAFDYHAGRVRQAPRFVQRSGLEWVFRLAMEPRRLWRRYLTNNPRFVWLLAAQKLGLRKFPMDA